MTENNIKIYDVVQRSLEWHEARAGKFTASDFHFIMGKESKTRSNIIFKKVCERINGYFPEENCFINADMQRGIDLEDEARNKYEEVKGIKVTQVGFVELNGSCGCSPDGLVENDGILEIKAPKDAIFLERFIDNKIPADYYTQMQFNLYITGRLYCDYMNYNKNFELNFFIERVERDEEYIEKIKTSLEKAEQEVTEIKQRFEQKLIESGWI